MFKMGLHCSFGHLKLKLWPKERLRVKLLVWLPTTKKLGIDPIYLSTNNMQHTVGKLLMRATTFLQTSSQFEVCLQSYDTPKSRKSQRWQFRDSHLGVSGQKGHLNVGPMGSHRVYYKGEGGGFPQVQAVVSLICPSWMWLVLTPKVFQLCTNHFMLVLCKSVWVDKGCQLFIVPSCSSSTPLYPSKVLWVRERALTPYCFVVLCLGLTFESLKELGVHHLACHCHPCSFGNNLY